MERLCHNLLTKSGDLPNIISTDSLCLSFSMICSPVVHEWTSGLSVDKPFFSLRAASSLNPLLGKAMSASESLREDTHMTSAMGHPKEDEVREVA